MKDNRSFPRRPSLTPVFTTAMIFWLSCAAMFGYARNLSADECRVIAVSCMAFSLALAIIGAWRRLGIAAFAMAALLAGISLASSEGLLLHARASQDIASVLADARVTLLQDTSDAGYRPQALALLQVEGGSPLTVLVSFPEKATYICGQSVCLDAKLEPADFERSDYAWRNGASHIVTAQAARVCEGFPLVSALVDFRLSALEVLGSSDADWSVLQALVCGYRANVRDTSLYASYQSCGLAHLVAVSGAHLVIVMGFAMIVLRRLRAPRRASVFILVVLMCCYVVVAGMPVSAIRAAIMSSVGILSLFGKRRPSSLNSLGIGLFAIITVSPHASLSASLALSALSAAGIIVFSPLIERMLERPFGRRASFIVDPLSLTISAALLAQPYSCALFSQLPVISPLSNIVCAPLFPLCCGLGLVGVLLQGICHPVALAVLNLAHLCVQLLDFLIVLLDRIPMGTVPVSIGQMPALVLSFVLCAALWLLWEKAAQKRLIIGLAGFAIVYVTVSLLSPRPDCIAMLDVGQGDSFLLRSGGKTLLIDTGNQDAQLLDQLARLGIYHLDGVLITHADDDHYGSLDALARAVEVDNAYVADDMITCDDESCKRVIQLAQDTAGGVNGLTVGDRLSIGGFSAEVLWPIAYGDEGGNGDSLVLRVLYDADGDGAGDISALFTGDAESKQLEALEDEEAIGSVDILKVGHHGSANSFTAEQLEALQPSIALIGVGEGNRYGHPTQEVLDMLESEGVTVLRSDLDGGIQLVLGKDTVKIETF